jgi:hypothetical protein
MSRLRSGDALRRGSRGASGGGSRRRFARRLLPERLLLAGIWRAYPAEALDRYLVAGYQNPRIKYNKRACVIGGADRPLLLPVEQHRG